MMLLIFQMFKRYAWEHLNDSTHSSRVCVYTRGERKVYILCHLWFSVILMSQATIDGTVFNKRTHSVTKKCKNKILNALVVAFSNCCHIVKGVVPEQSRTRNETHRNAHWCKQRVVWQLGGQLQALLDYRTSLALGKLTNTLTQVISSLQGSFEKERVVMTSKVRLSSSLVKKTQWSRLTR